MPKASVVVPDAILSSRGPRSRLSVISILVLAATAGLVGALPVGAALIVVGLMAAVAIFSLIRMVFATSFAAVPGPDAAGAVDCAWSNLLAPRFLCYAGILFIA